MILVDVAGLTARRPHRALFEDLSLTVSSGDRLAVVGVNGTGKSTLLGVLAGSRSPDSGTLRRGRGARYSHLDQDAPLPAGTVASVTGGLAAGDRQPGQSWQAAAIRDRLDLSGLEDRPTDQLSGGQAKRVALARALLACGPPGGGPADDADLLILDEPTNHLDLAAIAWLEEWLAGFRGGLVLVSHDRHVLDRVCNRMVELDRGRAHVHEGGYTSYLEARADRGERAEAAEAKRRNLARAEAAWLRRGAPARTSKPRARVEAATALVEGPERSADVRDRALDLHLDTPRLGDKVIEARGVGVAVGDQVLVDGLDLLLDNRERLGIVGPNGVGKTTLLRTLAGLRAPDGGHVAIGSTVRVGVFSQDGNELEASARVRDLVAGGAKELTWQDAALLERFWFDSDAQWAPVGTLSGGERRRLQLLLCLLGRPNVLFLDEPTNDLDLDTLRVLEDFLDDWPGALVVVSHDRALLERTVTDVLVLDGAGAATRRPGGLAAYLAEVTGTRAPGKAGRRDDRSRAPGGRAVAGERTGRSDGSAIRRRLNEAERRLRRAAGGVEASTAALDAVLAEAPDDHRRMAEVGSDLASARAELEAAEEAWLELAEEAEDVNPNLL